MNREIESCCDAFEIAWQKATREQISPPMIEDYLSSLPLSLHSEALLELLLIDWERRSLHRADEVEDYLEDRRFERSVVKRAYDIHFKTVLDLLDDQQVPTEGDRQGKKLVPPDLTGSRFRVVKFHREGGLGRIWIGHDNEVDREVAIKEIQSELAHHVHLRERFLREARLTVKLEHPGVVPIYGVQESNLGELIYAMRFIHGESMREAIRRQDNVSEIQRDGRLQHIRSLVKRLVSVCTTIDYAHHQGILHRDLKPDNVMLGPFGETLVVDWGLATEKRQQEESHPSDSLSRTYSGELTRDGQVVGTFGFMSPEQASGETDRLTPATDIFSLGAILYNILTGKPSIRASSYEEGLEMARANHLPTPRSFDRMIPRSLEAICLKAMQTEPRRRYQCAADMAIDLERWLDDEPVGARRETLVERGARWTRRHRGVMAVGTVSLSLISVLSVASAIVFDSLRTRAVDAKLLAEANAHRARRGAYAAQLSAISQLIEADPTLAMQRLHDPRRCPGNLRGFAWAHLVRRCNRMAYSIPVNPSSMMTGGTPVGRPHLAGETWDHQLVMVGTQGEIRLWAPRTSELTRSIASDEPLREARVNPAGRLLAGLTFDGHVRIWPLDRKGGMIEVDHREGRFDQIAFTPGGTQLAVLFRGDEQCELQLLSLLTGKVIHVITLPIDVTAMDLSPDGQYVAIARKRAIPGDGEHGEADLPTAAVSSPGIDVTELELRRIDTGEAVVGWKGNLLNKGWTDQISMLRFLDGRNILVANDRIAVARFLIDFEQSTLSLSELETAAHSGRINVIDYRIVGNASIAISGGEASRTVRWQSRQSLFAWDPYRLADVRPLAAFNQDVMDVVILGDGGTESISSNQRSLAVLLRDGAVVVLDLGQQWARSLIQNSTPVHAVAFQSDEDDQSDEADVVWLADGALKGSLEVGGQWRDAVQPVEASEAWCFPSLVATGGLAVASSGESVTRPKQLTLHRFCDGRASRAIDISDGRRPLAVASACDAVLTIGPNQVLAIESARDAQSVIQQQIVSNPRIEMAAISPSGQICAWIDDENQMSMWQPDGVDDVWTHDLGSSVVTAMRFDDDGQMLAVATSTVKEQAMPVIECWLLDVPKREFAGVLDGHTDVIRAIAFEPKSHIIATGGDDWQVKLWERESQTEILSGAHAAEVTSLEFSPDGRMLASSAKDSTIQVWKTADRTR